MGENNMMVVVNNMAHDRHKKLTDMRDHAYNGLIELAELDDSEITDSCDMNMKFALETILKYGTCADAACAISHFIDYKFATYGMAYA